MRRALAQMKLRTKGEVYCHAFGIVAHSLTWALHDKLPLTLVIIQHKIMKVATPGLPLTQEARLLVAGIAMNLAKGKSLGSMSVSIYDAA